MLSRGRAQTFPVQPLSCQSTRIVPPAKQRRSALERLNSGTTAPLVLYAPRGVRKTHVATSIAYPCAACHYDARAWIGRKRCIPGKRSQETLVTRSILKLRLERLKKGRVAKKSIFSNVVLVGVYDNNDYEIVDAGIGEDRIARLPMRARGVNCTPRSNSQDESIVCSLQQRLRSLLIPLVDGGSLGGQIRIDRNEAANSM